MLTSLSLTNFKSWKRIEEMRLAPITGLFGMNSSGKSSILQLLLMMKQTVESSNRNQALNLKGEPGYFSFGGFVNVVHRHESPARLQWEFSWRLPEELKVAGPEAGEKHSLAGRELAFKAMASERGSFGAAAIARMAYRFAGHEFGMEDTGSGVEYRLFAAPEAFRFQHVSGRPAVLPPPVKCYGFPDEVRAYYQNAGFLADLELEFERLFSRLHYLGPIREPPRREYRWTGTQPADVGSHGEFAIDALLAG